MKQVHAVFFSPTGTTRRVISLSAQAAADTLALPLTQTDFTLPSHRNEARSFSSDELVVIGLPVYAGRLPNVLLPFLKTIHGDGTPAVFMVVYGNRAYDEALAELGLILQENGFKLIAGAAFIGEHAFSQELAKGRPDRRDRRKLERFGKEAAEQFLKEPEGKDLWQLLREAPRAIRPYYTPRDREGNPINILKVRSLVDPEKCIGCGRCASLCPMGSIDPADVSRYTGICIKCGACIKGCPEGARYYTDPGFLTHKQILEEDYTHRQEPVWFL